MLAFMVFGLVACRRTPGPRDPKIQVWKEVPYKKAKDPKLAQQWSLKKIQADKAWKLHQGSSQIVVALIGTGVDYNHPDLMRNIWLNPGEADRKKRENGKDDDGNGYVDDVIGWDFVDGDNTPYDRHGVDTHAAGIISAVKDNGIGVAGIAPRTSLMVLRYINDRGYGYLWDAIEAIRYAIRNGARIIYFNWSYGFAKREYAKYLGQAFREAEKKGILIITGAGNQSNNVDGKAIYPPSFHHENLIVVGASTKEDRLAGMSNFGRRNVDIVAPGVDVFSTLPGGKYGRFSGTATAAAHVVGAAALTLSYRASNMPVSKVKEFLLGQKRVDYIPELDAYILSGGRLNVYKALSQ
ncbi:MAG: hypothetical protein D6805_01655 [Planctomycetota bacterium]|nr:MAG: hypothetical protein D6805_01655 [Planctomycetota bacterium]